MFFFFLIECKITKKIGKNKIRQRNVMIDSLPYFLSDGVVGIVCLHDEYHLSQRQLNTFLHTKKQKNICLIRKN